MTTYQVKCSDCNKPAIIKSTFKIETKTVAYLQCGHMMAEDLILARDPSHIQSLDGKRPFPYQADGVRFIESANGTALIADEMGLGKTVQALCALRLHPEMLPFLGIVKSGLKVQWQKEAVRWLSASDEEDDMFLTQIIEDKHTLPGMKGYFVSFDYLRNLVGSSVKDEFYPNSYQHKPSKADEFIKKLGIKTIIIDECQTIKNPDSARTREVRALCRSVPHIIALSGTPIKNHADEYFSILNILKPKIFSNHSEFLRNDVDSYWTGFSYKVGGLKNVDAFKRKTENFILRRTRAEVLPDLPQITRNFHFSDLGPEVEAQYLATFKQFRDDYDEGPKTFGEDNTLAYLSKMRHLTGLSKIKPCLEFVEEFLESTDRKLTIFVHHKDVGEILKNRLTHLCEQEGYAKPLSLSADMDSDKRAQVVDAFLAPATLGADPRILIASTLASGEGLNLQQCSDCVMLERQWNPASEEQAEARFIRIGQTADKITGTYFVAVGTVDEFFSEIVERKREIVTKTLGGEAVKWDQSGLISELAEVLALKGGRKWSI